MKSSKTILNSLWFYFFIGLVLRALFLLYNVSLALEPSWTSLTTSSLVAAEAIMGKAITFNASPQGALDLLRVSDRGTALAHMVLIWIFGKTSFLSLRIVNITLDSLMIVVAGKIGARLGGLRLSKASALAYAFFPPSVFICLNPFWYGPLAAGALTFTWLVLELLRIEEWNINKIRFFLYCILLLFIAVLTSFFRSTFVLYPLFMAAWILFANLISRKQKFDYKIVNRTSLALFCIGFFTLGSGSAINTLLYGGHQPMRGDLGHVLWCGFGEFKNPMGVKAEDSSIYQYYCEKTGRTQPFTSYSDPDWPKYDVWLVREGVNFIRSHPLLYSSMVIRRDLKFLFPNFRISRVSDLESYNFYEEKVMGTREARLAIVKSPLLYTREGLTKLWQIDKNYFFEGAFRVLLIFTLPLLLIGGFLFFGFTPNAFLAFSFMAYNLCSLGFIRGPDMNLFSAWSAIVPLAAAGMLYYFDTAKRIKRKT